MIDWARVKELRGEVGEEDFDEVVEIFLEEVDEVIGRMKGGLSQAPLEEDLHFLKGSSLNLGFASFSSLCSNGEALAASGQSAEVNLDEVYAAYDQSKSTFLSELPSLS